MTAKDNDQVNALTIEGLGKRYRISAKDAEDSTVSAGEIARGVKNLFKRGVKTVAPGTRDFWASSAPTAQASRRC
jgi:hypothetical protein